jgi:hypothetical protein
MDSAEDVVIVIDFHPSNYSIKDEDLEESYEGTCLLLGDPISCPTL